MGVLTVGTKLDLLSRHQSFRRFAPRLAVGEVIDVPADQPYHIRVRVYGHDYDSGNGDLHWLPCVRDTVWLEQTGIRVNSDGTSNPPHVHEIVGSLADDEFDRRRAALRGRPPAEPGPAPDPARE